MHGHTEKKIEQECEVWSNVFIQLNICPIYSKGLTGKTILNDINNDKSQKIKWSGMKDV